MFFVLSDFVYGEATLRLHGSKAEVVRAFSEGALSEIYQVIWMEGQKDKRPQAAGPVTLYPNGVHSNGYWLRNGAYRLKRSDGSDWIAGQFKRGVCYGRWLEKDASGKTTAAFSCPTEKTFPPLGEDKKSPFYLALTDFHFEAGELVLQMNGSGQLHLKIPMRHISLSEGSPIVSLENSKSFNLKVPQALIADVQSLAQQAGLAALDSKYENKTIQDGTTRTVVWKDGEQRKTISCYVDCPESVKQLYRKVVDRVFGEPSLAAALSSIGAFHSPGR